MLATNPRHLLLARARSVAPSYAVTELEESVSREEWAAWIAVGEKVSPPTFPNKANPHRLPFGPF